jgi:hypothetical protein
MYLTKRNFVILKPYKKCKYNKSFMENPAEEIINEPVYSKNVLEFLRVAHEYCLFTESIFDRSAADILKFYQRIAPLLYLKGLLLPEITPEFPESTERFVTEEEWESIFNELRAKFSNNDEYWYSDPDNKDVNDLIKASLSENMTDIYQDLKDFVLLYQKGSRATKEAAVAEVFNLFQSRCSWAILHSLPHVQMVLQTRK